MEKLIEQSMLDILLIKVFGEKISEYSNSEEVLSNELGTKMLSIVNVSGIQFNGICMRIQKPLTLVLPGKGSLPDSCGFESSKTIKMWSVRKGTVASKIDLSSGKIEELLPSELRGLIDAGIKIKNVTYKNGKLKGRIEVWVKVGVKISHGENFSIDTGLGSWVTITGFDLGVADVKVQVKLDSINKVCARLKACADFPWPIGEQCAKATHCIKF